MRHIITESYCQLKYKLRCRERERYGDADELYRRYAKSIFRHGTARHGEQDGMDVYSSSREAFLGDDALNSALAEKIISGEPFMLGRFGAVELFNMRTDEFGHAANAGKACTQLYECAGFFPNDTALLPRFNQCMKDACAATDIIGIWFNPAEDYFIKKYCINLEAICRLSAIEPWRSAHPWSAALKGKKVLVVHPFEDSIRAQYEKRALLFENPDILPDFTLLTLKAVQTAGNETDERFTDWFAALEYMCAECDKLDFDIALVGCGAYGFPLAAHIRKTGRQAVHFGGSLQILFGIKGDRWDRFIPDVVAMYNEHWNYPLQSEMPKGSVNVEGGTYWKGNA